MATQNLTENVILVALPPEPKANAELKALNEKVSNRCDRDVIIDFALVEILTSPSISNLIILHNWIHGADHRLIFCNMKVATKCIFRVAGLDTFFEFADGRAAALVALGQLPEENP